VIFFNIFQTAERNGLKRRNESCDDGGAPSKQPVLVDLTCEVPVAQAPNLAFTAAYSILLTSDEVRIMTFIIFFISGDRLNPHKGLF
jgi:hypothetical protein